MKQQIELIQTITAPSDSLRWLQQNPNQFLNACREARRDRKTWVKQRQEGV